MAGNNVRKYFVGDARACPRCERSIVVTETMVRRRKYVCAACESRAACEWAKKNRDRKRESNNRYSRLRSGKRAAATAAYRTRHPERARAHWAVQTAIRNGTLVKIPCEVCGLLRSSAHHDDYSKPLLVRWLCHAHHMELHQSMLAAREAAR